jgi:two-component system nitrogen regulation sensor histidine kinase GlnL
VLGSAHGLVQVLINLLSNARDACRKTEGARIIVRTRFASGLQVHSAGQGSRCVCRSRCASPTMGRASIRPCATIFSSLCHSKKSGQGLGLALVRKLVRDMNGRITHDRDEAGAGPFPPAPARRHRCTPSSSKWRFFKRQGIG